MLLILCFVLLLLDNDMELHKYRVNVLENILGGKSVTERDSGDLHITLEARITYR